MLPRISAFKLRLTVYETCEIALKQTGQCLKLKVVRNKESISVMRCFKCRSHRGCGENCPDGGSQEKGQGRS